MPERDLPQIGRRTLLKGAAALAGAVVLEHVTRPLSALAMPFPQDDRYGEQGAAETPSPLSQSPSEIEAETGHVFQAGEFVRRADHSQNRIYLSFDDCYNLNVVSQVADICEREGAGMTFFTIGKEVIRNKTFWGKIIQRGFAVENHTWDHHIIKGKTRTQIEEEFSKQRDAVRQAAQTVGINNYQEVFIRPPAGRGKTDPVVEAVCREYGLVIAMWSSDPQGWRRTVTTDDIVRIATKDLENGMILLQHTGEPKDVEALPRIIRAAKQRGYVMNKTMRDGIPTSVYTPHESQAETPDGTVNPRATLYPVAV